MFAFVWRACVCVCVCVRCVCVCVCGRLFSSFVFGLIYLIVCNMEGVFAVCHMIIKLKKGHSVRACLSV